MEYKTQEFTHYLIQWSDGTTYSFYDTEHKAQEVIDSTRARSGREGIVIAKPFTVQVPRSPNKTFSVWVDGAEFNAYYMTEAEAHRMAARLRDIGYESVNVRCERKSEEDAK